MWKTLIRKIALFLWEHSTKNKPMIPKGTVDTVLLHSQTENFLEQLKVYLQEGPDTYRKMQLNSYYAKNCCPDFNEAVCSHLYVSRLCSIYALQYYVMYSLLIQALLEKNIHELELLVFGCGSMIDSLSLSFALREYENRFKVHYTGVDIAKWEATYSNPFETIFIQ